MVSDHCCYCKVKIIHITILFLQRMKKMLLIWINHQDQRKSVKSDGSMKLINKLNILVESEFISSTVSLESLLQQNGNKE